MHVSLMESSFLLILPYHFSSSSNNIIIYFCINKNTLQFSDKMMTMYHFSSFCRLAEWLLCCFHLSSATRLYSAGVLGWPEGSKRPHLTGLPVCTGGRPRVLSSHSCVISSFSQPAWLPNMIAFERVKIETAKALQTCALELTVPFLLLCIKLFKANQL